MEGKSKRSCGNNSTAQNDGHGWQLSSAMWIDVEKIPIRELLTMKINPYEGSRIFPRI